MKISLRILLALILAAPARAGVTRVPRAGIEATSPALAAGTAPGALPVTALDGGALSLPISAPTQAVAVPDGSANSPVVGTRSEDAAVVDDSPAPPAEPVPAENSPTPIVRGSASRDDAAPDPAKHPAAHAAVQAVAENSAVRQAASGSANAPTGLAALFDLSPAALEAAAPGMQGSYWQAPQYRLETLGLSPYPPFDQDFQAEKHASEVFAHVLNDRFLLRGLLRDDPGSFPMSDRRVYEARNLVHRLQTILRIPFGLIEKTAARLAHSRMSEWRLSGLMLTTEAGHHSREDSFMSALYKAAAAALSAEHMAVVASRVDRLYRELFPSFLVPFQYMLYTEAHGAVSGFHATEISLAHRITMGVNRAVLPETEHLTDPAFPDVESVVPGEHLQRRVSTLLTFFHEQAHAIFDEVVMPARIRPGREHLGSGSNAFGALTEGFAVMMELILVDKLTAAAAAYGLTERDVADLRRWKALRMAWLERVGPENHYTIGTVHFWHKVYKRGGEEGMLRFLRGLDGEKLLAMPLGDPRFRALYGKPEDALKVLGRD